MRRLKTITTPRVIGNIFSYVQTGSFILAFIQNIIIIASLKPSQDLEHEFRINREYFAQLIPDQQMEETLQVLQYIQISFGAFMLIYVVYKLAPLQWFKFKRDFNIIKSGNGFEVIKRFNQMIYAISYFFKYFFFDIEFTYYFIYCFFATFGILNPFFSALLLLDIFKRVPIAQQIVTAIFSRLGSLLVTLLIFLIVSYYFTIIVFFYRYDNPQYEWYVACKSSLRTCYVYIIDRTFKTDAGFISNWSNYEFGWSVFFDFFYVLLLILFVTQIMGGLIIDAFATLRENAEGVFNDKETYCFICGLHRQVLDGFGNQGFIKHIQTEHNLWNYIFYIFYIKQKQETEYTGIESYVRQCIDKNQINWFPIYRSYQLELSKQKDSQELENVNQQEKPEDKEYDKLEEKIQELQTRIEQLPQIIAEEVDFQRQKIIERMDKFKDIEEKNQRRLRRLNRFTQRSDSRQNFEQTE